MPAISGFIQQSTINIQQFIRYNRRANEPYGDRSHPVDSSGDAWAAENEGMPHSEAIRRLVELGLKAKGGKR